jgi:hypothetical protein
MVNLRRSDTSARKILKAMRVKIAQRLLAVRQLVLEKSVSVRAAPEVMSGDLFSPLDGEILPARTFSCVVFVLQV